MGVAIEQAAPGKLPVRKLPGKAPRGEARPGKAPPDEALPAEDAPEKGRASGKRAAKKARGGERRRAAKRGGVKGATRRVEAEQRPPRNHAWLNWLLILVGAGVVIAAAVQAYSTLQSIPVQHIVVTGELEHTRTEALQEMVQPALVGGFLRADLQRIRLQLEALPWIYEASVRRRWPNALEIDVVEQLPIARWGENGFLNHEGQVFRPSNDSDWQALPLLQGPEGAARTLMATYQRMVELLSSVGLAVTRLAVDDRGQVEAELEGGIRLLLGGSDFLERMHRFLAIYRSELAARAGDVERVDMRYESGIAVAYREPPLMADIKQ
ncbi:MAG: cell division protein FtsQ/DivIB [Halioglobus sp.]